MVNRPVEDIVERIIEYERKLGVHDDMTREEREVFLRTVQIGLDVQNNWRDRRGRVLSDGHIARRMKIDLPVFMLEMEHLERKQRLADFILRAAYEG